MNLDETNVNCVVGETPGYRCATRLLVVSYTKTGHKDKTGNRRLFDAPRSIARRFGG